MSAKQNTKLCLVILKYILDSPSEIYTALALTNKLNDLHDANFSHIGVWYNLNVLTREEFLSKEGENFKLKLSIQRASYEAFNKIRATII